MIERRGEKVLVLPNGTSFRSTYPIEDFWVRGDLLLVASDPGGGKRNYRAVPLDASAFERTHKRPLVFWAQVEGSTNFDIDPDDRCALVVDGIRSELPGWVTFVEEIAEGYGVLVSAADVPERNLFLLGRDGAIRWRALPNPELTGTAQAYDSITTTGDGALVAVLDRAGRWIVDPSDGSLTSC